MIIEGGEHEGIEVTRQRRDGRYRASCRACGQMLYRTPFQHRAMSAAREHLREHESIAASRAARMIGPQAFI